MTILWSDRPLRKGQTRKTNRSNLSPRELKPFPVRDTPLDRAEFTCETRNCRGGCEPVIQPLLPRQHQQSEHLPVAATTSGRTHDSAIEPTLLLPVPDYIQADWLLAEPSPAPRDIKGDLARGRRRIGGLYWAILQAVIVQKSSQVILADVALAQLRWGGQKSRWPRNWRNQLVQRLKRAAMCNVGLAEVAHREGHLGERACPQINQIGR